MKMKLLIAAAALAPLAVIAVENSKTQPSTPAGSSSSFESLDTNQDGRISMPEASADPSLLENFSKADKNGDGYLDNAEYDKGTQQR